MRDEEVSGIIGRLSQSGSPLSSRMIAVMLQISLGMRTGTADACTARWGSSRRPPGPGSSPTRGRPSGSTSRCRCC
ncbi:hypothetical protein ACR6C2_25310 [Streptomyces sp. INA 01156]